MGKTTTIKSICGILKPHSGKIGFNSVKINGMESYKIARLGIGLVPEGRRIFANLTVKENLIGSSVKGYWDLDKILTLFPIFEERLFQLSSNLSGGEQQRLALARALAVSPKLLLLDEPCAHLDPNATVKVEHMINSAVEADIKVIMVTHDAAQARRLGEEFILMHRGEVLAQHRKDQFFAQNSNKNLARFLAGETLSDAC